MSRKNLITIYRDIALPGSTMGVLYFKDEFECWTLEDPTRSVKVPGVTAIPQGGYFGRVTMSPAFGRPMILIYNRPDYSIQRNGLQFLGVRVHAGNDAGDSSGCTLVGKRRDKEKGILYQSRLAEDELTTKVIDAVGMDNEFMVSICEFWRKQ